MRHRGQLPRFSSNAFGGQPCGVTLISGALYECQVCHLWFRYPRTNSDVLHTLYENLPATVWTCPQQRHYWGILLGIINRYVTNKIILDVGCFSGDFLSWLPSTWTKLGIEPNRSAAELARKNGIQIIGASLEMLKELPESFTRPSVITLIDVLEHLDNPLAVLKSMKDILMPGGIIIIVTGDTGFLPWRLLAPDYWYSSLPEHNTFYSKRWFQWAGQHLGMRIVSFRSIASEKIGFLQSMLQGSRSIGYALIKKLKKTSWLYGIVNRLPVFRRALKWQTPPWWTGAEDHLILGLQ